jgi:antitoxin (DNA-binding transcriptional repressor) of toxin-antitoxin stability system
VQFNPSVTEVSRNFASYINRVAFHGERFTLMRGGKAVAELRPLPVGRHLRELPELLASLPRLDAADRAALAEDLDRARQELAQQSVKDPWAS